MNLLNALPIILVIAFFGLLAIGAIAAFVISIIEQRRYDSAALPSLDLPETEEVVTDDESVTESRFASLDDEFTMDDEETNELMKNLNRLEGIPEKKESKKGFSLFGKPKTNNKGKDGDSDANS